MQELNIHRAASCGSQRDILLRTVLDMVVSTRYKTKPNLTETAAVALSAHQACISLHSESETWHWYALMHYYLLSSDPGLPVTSVKNWSSRRSA